MGNIIGSLCNGTRHVNDDFVQDNQNLLNKMMLYLENERERKEKKLKIIENKLNKKTLRRLFK
tara:strand:- start:314 stop:502 length:189 start_codon:yes stop_codon:yes gene_type:complete